MTILIAKYDRVARAHAFFNEIDNVTVLFLLLFNLSFTILFLDDLNITSKLISMHLILVWDCILDYVKHKI